MRGSAAHDLFALAAPVSAQVGPAIDTALRPMTVAIVLALVGLVPLLFMSLTAFVKISTVLHIARSALGAPEVPSGSILLVLSLALTLVAMAPLGTRIGDRVVP